ncbi:UvrD-helicase domain-containing protein [Sporosarcina sp. FSL W7-1283]|uniref:UvrD-helicase domain-containing protein n=1 Tax=Sporosarcina sp. FSL W7-1283 TaxID=2921560 RepID=UPI0030F6AC81
MVTRSKNLTLIHAPAGSGKTTKIESYLIKKSKKQEFSKKVLCITFTNRAAEELQRRIENPMVDIFTIHSFLSQFFKNHQKEKQIIEEYYNFYKDDIESELIKYKEMQEDKSDKNKENITYRKWVELEETNGEIRSSIQLKKVWLEKGIKYNERIWSSYLFGELSHDDLLQFAEFCFNKVPKLRKRLTFLYEEVIIDEYQDTDPSVIRAFYYAVKNTETCFKLIGDEMQNIYGSSHFIIRKILNEFTLDKTMLTNYRSPTEIVDILNKIYNDASIKQVSYTGSLGINPRLFISNEINGIRSKYPDYLLLVPTVREVLSSASELYEEYVKLPEYKHNNSKNVKLTDVINFEKSVDPLMEILNQSSQMIEYYLNNEYVSAMSIYMRNKVVKEKVLKRKILRDFNLLCDFQNKKDENRIHDYISLLESLSLWKKEIELIKTDKYQPILELFYNNYLDGKKKYLSSSTQHGVKGESHKKVMVYLKNNARARVYMTDFLQLWSMDEKLNLTTFEKLFDKFNNCPIQEKIKALEKEKKGNIANKEWHDKYHKELESHILLFKEKYQKEKFIDVLAPNTFETYLNKPNVTNYNKLLIGKALESKINNVAMTYKLFYVVLSRAQEDLIVVLDKDLENERIVQRFISIGFQLCRNN